MGKFITHLDQRVFGKNGEELVGKYIGE